jgi:hypothetical protein
LLSSPRPAWQTFPNDAFGEATVAQATMSEGTATAPRRKPWYTVLYIQVLIAIAIGIAIGHFYPQFGTALKPLGDAFIALIKMMIAPVIFCTVVHGIASIFVGAFAGGDLLQVDSVRRAANYLKRHRHSSSERSRPASSKAASAVTSNREIGNAHVGMQFGRRHLSSSGKFFGEPDLAARGVVVSREKGLKSRQDCVLQDFASLVRAHRSFILP